MSKERDQETRDARGALQPAHPPSALSPEAAFWRREQFQEPAQRPAIVSRAYVLDMLSRIFGRYCPEHLQPAWVANLRQMGGMKGRARFCPEDLLPAWLDYFEKKGVVVRNGESYGLPEQPEALSALPKDAMRGLHEAITIHAMSDACPELLKYVIPALHTGGSSAQGQSRSNLLVGVRYKKLPSPPDHTKEIERLRWDRQRHLQDLADFDPHAATMFDWIIETLENTPPAMWRTEQPRQSNHDLARQHEERLATQRKKNDQAIDDADIPRLAQYWHAAMERLCAPGGDPMTEDLHVLWRTSQRLAVAAETHEKPRRSLLTVRGATIGLPGNVDHARKCFASDPKLVRLRTEAAVEIGDLLVAWEIQTRVATTCQLPEGTAADAKAAGDRARQQEEAARQADQLWKARASGSTPSDIPSLDKFRAIIPQIVAGLTLATQASAAAPDSSLFSLRSIAVAQDPMAKAIRFGRKHLDGLANRIVGINPPQIRTTLLGKTITATCAVGLLHGLCAYLYTISASLRLGQIHQPEALAHAAKQLGSSVQGIGLEQIEQRAVAEIDMLRVLESEASSDPGPGRGQHDTNQHAEAASTQTNANAAVDNLAEAIAKKVAEKLPSPERKADADLDEIGLDLLRAAWNDGDGYQPSWRKLANAAHGGLTQRGRVLRLQTVVTHLKQRAPRTKALMDEIRTELENRKQTSKAAGKKKSLPPEW